MTQLTYIYHDGFLLETPLCNIVFDFWRLPSGEEATEGEMPCFLQHLTNPSLPLYILVSHFHKDHFNPVIFSWLDFFPHAHFIISKDTARHARRHLRADSMYRGRKVPGTNYTVLRPGETYSAPHLTIRAFSSTDTGNSYALSVGDLRVFHAGDLNAWMWKDESTEKEVNAAINAYEKILKEIAAEFPTFDIAMFPVDSRIGTDWWEGASRFVRAINVKRFIPMHFELADTPEQLQQRHRDALDFRAYANTTRGEYLSPGRLLIP